MQLYAITKDVRQQRAGLRQLVLAQLDDAGIVAGPRRRVALERGKLIDPFGGVFLDRRIADYKQIEVAVRAGFVACRGAEKSSADRLMPPCGDGLAQPRDQLRSARGKELDPGGGHVLPIQAVEVCFTCLPAQHNPLVDQALSRFAHSRLGTVPEQPVNATAAEVLVGTGQDSKNVTVQSRRHSVEKVPEIHFSPN